jgi:hypothetical protein
MISPTEGWAAGGNWRQGVLLHYDGVVWETVPQSSTYAFYDIEMLSPSEGRAVGGERSGNIILYYDGTTWESVSAPPTDLSITHM